MDIFATDEPTVAVRMTGFMSYGPSDTNGVPGLTLHNGESYDVPASEALWLLCADIAEIP